MANSKSGPQLTELFEPENPFVEKVLEYVKDGGDVARRYALIFSELAVAYELNRQGRKT